MRKRTVANWTLASGTLSVLIILGGTFEPDFNKFSIGFFPGIAFSIAVISAVKHTNLKSQLLFVGLSTLLYFSMFAGTQFIGVSLKFFVIFPIVGAMVIIVIIHISLFSLKGIWYGLVRGFLIGIYSVLPLISIYFLWIFSFLLMPLGIIIWQERMGNYVDEMIYKYGNDKN